MTADTSLAQQLGPLFGAFYVTIGVLGFFVTGFHSWVQDTPDTVLGFSINPFANLVHGDLGQQQEAVMTAARGTTEV
jgi:hypothetical protein